MKLQERKIKRCQKEISLVKHGTKILLAIADSLALLSAETGCGSDSEQTIGKGFSGNAKCIEATNVTAWHYMWELLGGTGEDAAVAFVNAMIAGDVEGGDEILSRGKIGINDVSSFTVNYNVRRGKLYTEKSQCRSPEKARMVGVMYARLLNAYDKYDSLLGKNDVIGFCGTPLMMSARAGNPTIESFLLKQGTNPNIYVKTKGLEVQTCFGSLNNCMNF